MARPYSEAFLQELFQNNSDNLGVALGKLCVKANIPAAYVAVALGTSRVTVYSWFRGQGMREEKRKTIQALINLLQQDLDAGVLPAPTLEDAKAYIGELAGVTI